VDQLSDSFVHWDTGLSSIAWEFAPRNPDPRAQLQRWSVHNSLTTRTRQAFNWLPNFGESLRDVLEWHDELDIIAPARMGGNDPLTDEIVGQLLQELDGIQSRDSEVFLLAATNHAEQIDRAVLSRFQERLAIPLPDLHGRERLLTMLLQKKRLTFALEEGSHTLAAMSEGMGMSGRDLKNWIGRAEQKALLRAIATGGPQHFALTLDDFDSPVTETTVTG
jgi:SpoVK/Ycf46/Vps4 family AAA+-type ATPase